MLPNLSKRMHVSKSWAIGALSSAMSVSFTQFGFEKITSQSSQATASTSLGSCDAAMFSSLSFCHSVDCAVKCNTSSDGGSSGFSSPNTHSTVRQYTPESTICDLKTS